MNVLSVTSVLGATRLMFTAAERGRTWANKLLIGGGLAIGQVGIGLVLCRGGQEGVRGTDTALPLLKAPDTVNLMSFPRYLCFCPFRAGVQGREEQLADTEVMGGCVGNKSPHRQ